MQDAQHLLGIEFDGQRRFFSAIDYGRNFALHAYPACCVLVKLTLSRSGCDNFRDCWHCFFLSGTAKSRKFLVVSPQLFRTRTAPFIVLGASCQPTTAGQELAFLLAAKSLS